MSLKPCMSRASAEALRPFGLRKDVGSDNVCYGYPVDSDSKSESDSRQGRHHTSVLIAARFQSVQPLVQFHNSLSQHPQQFSDSHVSVVRGVTVLRTCA